MGEFFHGWRRKTGCVTLLMALLAMGAWVRGLFGDNYPSALATIRIPGVAGGFSCILGEGKTEGGRRPTGVLPSPRNFFFGDDRPLLSNHNSAAAVFDCLADSRR